MHVSVCRKGIFFVKDYCKFCHLLLQVNTRSLLIKTEIKSLTYVTLAISFMWLPQLKDSFIDVCLG